MISALIKGEHEAGTIGVLLQRANEILLEFRDRSGNHKDLTSLAKSHSRDHTSKHLVEEWKLKAILDKLREKEKITEAQAEAFLCTPAPTTSLKNFQALVLLCALEHQMLFGDGARPQRAMAAYRLLVEDRQKPKNLLNSLRVEDCLPDTSKSLEGILEAIEDAIKVLHIPGDNYVEQRLGPVRRILGDVIENRLENQRNRHNVSREKIDEKEAEDDISVDDNIELTETERLLFRQISETEEMPAYQEILVQPAINQKKQDASEYIADNQTSGLFLAMQPEKGASASLRRSKFLSVMHAKAVSGSIERREKRLKCLATQLSRHEINILIAELRNRMQTCDVAYLIYLVLATGRRPEDIFNAKMVSGYKAFDGFGNAYSLERHDLFWVYRHELPPHHLPGRQRALLDQQKAPVVLPVPCPVGKRKIPIMPIIEFEQQAKTLLKDINRSNSTKLSISKISDHLPNVLQGHGVDGVIIALIAGNPKLHEAGLYYSQYDTVSLYRAYQKYRQDHLQAETQDPIESNAAVGGSQLIVTDKAVVGIFDHLKQNLLQSQTLSWVEIHNRFVMYVLHFLYLATGHRPVRDPFDDINHIDLTNKKIFISDKESRFTASSARTLVLPDAAIVQIGEYKKHLERMHIHMQSFSPRFSDEIEQTLNGERSLFFLIRRGESASEIDMDYVSPRKVSAFWGDLLRLPSNWHRHFLRTYLMSQKMVSGEAIDTWMGHASPGQEGFTRYSGMSIRALEVIASRIEILLMDLKIFPLTSKGLAHE